MTVGENIKRIRKERGLTQKMLSELCGVNEVQIRRYELGQKNANPKIETIKKIADGLGVSLSELISEDYQSISTDSYFLPGVTPERAMEIIENMYDIWKDAGFSAKNPPHTDEEHLKVYETARRQELLKAFDTLNYHGKVTAVERIQELTEIPRYTQKEEN